jgi:hypothetical protein
MGLVPLPNLSTNLSSAYGPSAITAQTRSGTPCGKAGQQLNLSACLAKSARGAMRSPRVGKASGSQGQLHPSK